MKRIPNHIVGAWELTKLGYRVVLVPLNNQLPSEFLVHIHPPGKRDGFLLGRRQFVALARRIMRRKGEEEDKKE